MRRVALLPLLHRFTSALLTSLLAAHAAIFGS